MTLADGTVFTWTKVFWRLWRFEEDRTNSRARVQVFRTLAEIRGSGLSEEEKGLEEDRFEEKD